MRNLVLILIASVLLSCNSGEKSDIESQKENIEQAKEAFADLKICLEKDNAKLWNKSLDGPVLLVDRESRFIVANQKDKHGSLIEHEDVFIGTLPEDVIIANTAVEWNGTRWTMVAFPLPEAQKGKLSLLCHESFHRIQPELGFVFSSSSQPDHLDTKDGRILLKLELEALKTALDAEIHSDDPSIHIKNALRFRKYRYQIFPEAKQAENDLELNEGLAEYTGVQLSNIDAKAPNDYYMQKINGFYSFPSFVKSFAYVTIPVYGYFLQQKDNIWNLEIKLETNLTDFISETFEMSDIDIDQFDLQTLGELYRINSITDFESQKAFKKEKLLSFYKKRFLSDNTLIINLEEMSIGFDPTNMIPLEEHGTVYPTMRLTDNWGVLEVDSLGALLSPDWKTVYISQPSEITEAFIKGNGWVLKLNEGWGLVKKSAKYILIED